MSDYQKRVEQLLTEIIPDIKRLWATHQEYHDGKFYFESKEVNISVTITPFCDHDWQLIQDGDDQYVECYKCGRGKEKTK